MGVDDSGLIARARRGNEDAFSQLFSRHQRAIYRYGVYMCGEDAGDDIVQETFLAVLRQGGRADDPQGQGAAYLLGIARHLVMKRWARQGRAWEVAYADVTEFDVPDERQPSAIDAIAHAETIATVRAAVKSLPPQFREAVVLCELQGLDYLTAAGVMECPIGTVRSRLFRARALLRTMLGATKRTEVRG